jgi:hypothetical protein
VTRADLQDECAGLWVCTRSSDARIGGKYLSPSFVRYILRAFYETLNLRETRRRLAEYYSTNALAFSGETGALASVLRAVPPPEELRWIVLRAFRLFLRARVELLRERQYIYNGQGLRHDGNFDLATRVVPDGGNKYTVVVAFCGTDGSLMRPPVLRATEAWPDLESILRPLLGRLKAARVRAGFPIEHTLPAFHATDSYHKHKNLLAKIYRDVWPELRVHVMHATPKAVATGAQVVRTASPACLITGEPMHDIIALRKLVSPWKHDGRDFLFDHISLINRLSARPAPSSLTSVLKPWPPPSLSHTGLALLRVAIQEPAAAFAERTARPWAPDAAELAAFVQHARVFQSTVWRAEFRSKPPHGTVERIARRLGVELHQTCKPWQWPSLAAF